MINRFANRHAIILQKNKNIIIIEIERKHTLSSIRQIFPCL